MGGVRLLLVSTYELGHQPLQLATAASELIAAGHEVHCWDLAVQPWDDQAECLVAASDGVAISVPMHTAMRLGLQLARDLRSRHPDLPLALYGLYAAAAERAGAEIGIGALIAGEYAEGLTNWAAGLGGTAGRPGALSISVGSPRRRAAGLPARHLLPPLQRYATLRYGGEDRLVGYVEASRGCRHNCRHCPVPPVYGGRTRISAVEELLADVEALVRAGAGHITFGDPDFFNGPAHAMRVVDALHGAFPELSFDCTIKVEHILRQRHRFGALAAAGCLFVVSALESAHDPTLARLAKGHTVAEAAEAASILAEAGIDMRPSWMPFTPWTRRAHLADMVDFVAQNQLVDTTDPVQYSIRLLLPDGAALLGDEEVAAALSGYDTELVGWRWASPDPELDRLQASLAAIAEQAASSGQDIAQSWEQVRSAIAKATGRPAAGRWPGLRIRPEEEVPRLTEAWFCCAEPTKDQRSFLGASQACPSPAPQPLWDCA